MEKRSCIRKSGTRRGIVLVAVVVVFTIGLTLFGIWTRASLQQHRRLQSDQIRLQALRLAEAGVRRAVLRRSTDSEYDGEVWRLPAEAFGKSRTAQVRLHVTPNADNGALIYEATAEFPADGALHRAQITKRVEILGSPPAGAS